MLHTCLRYDAARYAIFWNRLADMEAAQEDLGDHEGTFQDRSRKKVRGRPYRLPGLKNKRGRSHPNREETVKFLVGRDLPLFPLHLIIACNSIDTLVDLQ
jgi:hypothetical protein